jgi:hypothetical protein
LCTQGKYGKSLGCKGVIAKKKNYTGKTKFAYSTGIKTIYPYIFHFFNEKRGRLREIEN